MPLRGPLGFGGAAIANLFAAVAEADALAAVGAAFEAGIAHFDTAPYYGSGLSEMRLGQGLAGRERSTFTLSTKVGRDLGRQYAREEGTPFVGDLPDTGVGFDYGARGMARSLEGSLARLGVDRVEVALVHDLDSTVHGDPEALARHRRIAVTEGWPTLQAMRRGGVVDAIGHGINNAADAAWLLERTDPDILLLAGRYTLLEHRGALGLLGACARRGIAVVIGGPYNSGILAAGSAVAAKYDYADPQPGILDRVRRLEAVCSRHGTPLAAVALQFVLAHPAVVMAVPGMRSAAEVRANAAWLETPVPTALWDDLRSGGLLDDDVPTP